jgi:hypothetical protein
VDVQGGSSSRTKEARDTTHGVHSWIVERNEAMNRMPHGVAPAAKLIFVSPCLRNDTNTAFSDIPGGSDMRRLECALRLPSDMAYNFKCRMKVCGGKKVPRALHPL